MHVGKASDLQHSDWRLTLPNVVIPTNAKKVYTHIRAKNREGCTVSSILISLDGSRQAVKRQVRYVCFPAARLNFELVRPSDHELSTSVRGRDDLHHVDRPIRRAAVR